MEAVYIALASCASISLLIIFLAIPLYLEKVKRNEWYGFRTPKTLSSDEIWYSANKDSAQNMIGAGIFILLSALILFFLRNLLSPSTLTIAIVVVTLAGLIGAVIKSFMFLSKLK